MSTLREAAQQALEALKMMRNEYGEANCPACDHADAAVYALNAALAEHYCDTPCTWADHAPGCELLKERNFCPRCGKRTTTLHTCTPPGAHHGPV